jgi:thioredoxin reductase (NADPH)
VPERLSPSIVIVSHDNAALLVDEFGRYARDYDIRPATSMSVATDVTTEIEATGGQVAMLVADSSLFPLGTHDDRHNVLAAFHTWRQVVPTAKRLVVAPWETFLEDADRLRAGLAKGKYDAFLLMPRGVRDEEFHTAICELLSDWGSTVAQPEIETVRLVAPSRLLQNEAKSWRPSSSFEAASMATSSRDRFHASTYPRASGSAASAVSAMR